MTVNSRGRNPGLDEYIKQRSSKYQARINQDQAGISEEALLGRHLEAVNNRR